MSAKYQTRHALGGILLRGDLWLQPIRAGALPLGEAIDLRLFRGAHWRSPERQYPHRLSVVLTRYAGRRDRRQVCDILPQSWRVTAVRGQYRDFGLRRVPDSDHQRVVAGPSVVFLRSLSVQVFRRPFFTSVYAVHRQQGLFQAGQPYPDRAGSE